MSDFNNDGGWNADRETPYVNWWRLVDGRIPSNIRDFDPSDAALFLDPLRLVEQIGILRGEISEVLMKPAEGEGIVKKYGHGSLVPLPKESENPNWPQNPGDLPDWITPEVINRLPNDVPKDAVIVGVIDTGVALGHRAFRLANGKTRIIASWQQTAEFHHQSADYLPFGEEWYAGDINGKLLDHSRDRNPLERLNEDSFNSDLRLVERQRTRGHRDLDHRAAHGTHIMDIAAGGDPASFADAAKLRMIVVNLPTQYLHGYAGNFLEFFAGYAIIRIFHLAEALWKKNNPGKSGGYPIALNLAYGMMAGPKDGSRLLEQLMDVFVGRREREDLPTSICMPAGNENLARAVARLETEASVFSEPIRWRTLPSDRTSNHLEFWFAPTAESPEGDLKDYVFKITAPNGRTESIKGPKHGGYADIPDFKARLYCLLHPEESNPTHVHFMLATSPTLIIERIERDAITIDGSEPLGSSPAGVWTIEVLTPNASSLSIYVQSDQSAKVQSHAGLRSYLDHQDYQPYLENGRVRDTYSYSLGSNEEPEDLEAARTLVTRKGSHNALATTTSNSAFAGFRRSDGRPAAYSATSFPPRPQFVQEIQAAYPTDDSPALYGILAAGARDGSSVAFRGTSMAAAMATREAANAMLNWAKEGKQKQHVPLGNVNWHELKGAEGERHIAGAHPYFGVTKPDKTGEGRVLAQNHHRNWRRASR